MSAAEQVRDAGYAAGIASRRSDHGMDEAMGQRRSIVPRISLCGGSPGSAPA